MHLPVNHPLRPVYRTLAGLIGAFILVFGVMGFFATRGMEFFATEGEHVLGLSTNPAFSVISVITGVIMLIAVVIGRNVDQVLNLIAACVFLVAGLAMMALLRTDLNFLAFTMTNCIVSFIFGLVTLAASLYGRVGTPESAAAEEQFRRGATT